MASLHQTLAFLEQRIQARSRSLQRGIDAYFPWRMAVILSAGLFQAVRLLSQPEAIAEFLHDNTHNPFVSAQFIYFRGWFILGVMALLYHAYTRSRYPATIFLLVFCFGCSNLVYDAFTIYIHHWRWPADGRWLSLLSLRVLGLWLLGLCVWHVGQLPHADRWNLTLPWHRRS